MWSLHRQEKCLKTFCVMVPTDRRTDGRTDGQTDGRTDRQTELNAVPTWNTVCKPWTTDRELSVTGKSVAMACISATVRTDDWTAINSRQVQWLLVWFTATASTCPSRVCRATYEPASVIGCVSVPRDDTETVLISHCVENEAFSLLSCTIIKQANKYRGCTKNKKSLMWQCLRRSEQTCLQHSSKFCKSVS